MLKFYSNVTLLSCVWLVFALIYLTEASFGDRSDAYQRCLYICNQKNCSNSTKIQHFHGEQAWYLSALKWECYDECEYHCMWHVVQVLKSRGYPIPQFHGKWPFLRIWGLQEPASVLFSVLNGFSHYFMWRKFKKLVPKDVALFNVWNFQALLSINAWIWSTVFHTRDTALTEKLDYFCAFSLVLYSLYCLFVKVFGRQSSWSPIAIAVPFFSYFTYHLYYLSYVKFDYGFNLKTNVFVGLLNSFGWMLWCYRNRHKRHVWKCAVSVFSVNLLLALELGDFPPIWHLVDAHAMWHMGTIPVPYFWYSFLIEECLFEIRQRKLL